MARILTYDQASLTAGPIGGVSWLPIAWIGPSVNLVPTTITREIEGMQGSLQAAVDRNGMAVTDYQVVDQQMMAVLDYVIANTDRNLSNWLTQEDGRPAAIDNGLSFPKSNQAVMLSPLTSSRQLR